VNIDELSSLDDDAAWKLVFPAGVPYLATAAHSNWQPWTKPTNLPIDDFVEDLIRQNRNPRDIRTAAIKPKSELHSLGIICPYYHVRHATWLAISRGRMWLQAISFHAERLPVRVEKQAQATKLAQSIESFLGGGLDPHVTFPTPLYSDRADPIDAGRRGREYRELEDLLFKARSALEKHAEQIAQDCERISIHRNARQNSWKAAFAAALGYCWSNLTGKMPTLTSTKQGRDFPTFVSRAFQLIGGSPDEKWERAIRQMLHDRPPRPEWDDFDRYEKDRWPPGTRFITTEEIQARHQAAQLQEEEELREIAKHIRRKTPTKTADEPSSDSE